MPADTTLPIVPTAIAAWRSGIDAIRAMRTLALTIFAILIPLYFVRMPLDDAAMAGGAMAQLGLLVFQVAVAFIATPFVIAVHRYVLLGELTPGYRLAPQDRRFQHFFGVSVALNVIGALPGLVMMSGGVIALIAGLVLLVVMFIVFVRATLLFPAIAVDAPGAQWRNAMDDSRGHVWPIFAVLVCTVLPVILVFVVGSVLFPYGSSGIVRGIGKIVEAAGATLAFAVLAAAASHIYKAYADRVGRPATLVPGVSVPL